MKKTFLILVIFAVFFISIFWIIKTYIGDIRPILFPVVKNNSISKPQSKFGTQIDIDLKLDKEFQIGVFAKDLGKVRDIVFSPGGVLIASVPESGKIIMLPDRNKDGIADEVNTIASRLERPHGVAFFNNYLYIAEETRVSRYYWTDQKLIGGVARLEKKLFNLPKGGNHTSRTITFDKSGTMYVSIGSSCDVCIEKHPFLASVIISDFEGKTPQIYAKGLRNSPFITINPDTQELWGTEMGRDFLGDNLPPDEINIIQNNKNYGWPLCYGEKVHDTKFDKNIYTDDPCYNTIPPIFQIPAHSAPLGLQFIKSDKFPKSWQGDLLVSYHGSWNRSSPIGYKVVRLDVEGNKIVKEEDFLTGFLQNGGAAGRPVDLEFNNNGDLFLSDDKSGSIYIISKK